MSKVKAKFDFGEAIGMLVGKWWCSAVRQGHHQYAPTYDFPVRIKFIGSTISVKCGWKRQKGWHFN